MRDKEDAKKRERAERLQEDLRLHKEAAKYNPWGKDKQSSREGVSNQAASYGQSQVTCNHAWHDAHYSWFHAVFVRVTAVYFFKVCTCHS